MRYSNFLHYPNQRETDALQRFREFPCLNQTGSEIILLEVQKKKKRHNKTHLCRESDCISMIKEILFLQTGFLTITLEYNKPHSVQAFNSHTYFKSSFS